jgi:hypothetical protein
VTAAEDLGALFRVAPETARARVAAAFRDAGGKATHAADLLGVSHRTVLRMLKDPGVASAVARIREEAKASRKAAP